MAAPKPASGAQASQEAAPAPIIIKKGKKKHGAHHGGAWKVAYADFVTAMMAFFLLLWLLNATTEEQKVGISNYFAPESVSRTNSGSGGPFGGQTINQEGALPTPSSPAGIVVPLPQRPRSSDDAPEAEDDAPEAAEDGTDHAAASGSAAARPTPEENGRMEERRMKEKERRERFHEREELRFIRAEEALRQSIQDSPDLKSLERNVLIDRTPEGLRIQIVDQSHVSMFPRGSSAMYDRTRRLLAKVAKAVAELPNKIAITGHTDATKYASARGYTNWELSADRANAARRVLLEMGVPADRIALVMGKADREPLIKDNPRDPRNRRIGILILYRQTGPAKAE